MTNIELLTFSSKAIGRKGLMLVLAGNPSAPYLSGEQGKFDPLSDSGDALVLAADLGMQLTSTDGSVWAEAVDKHGERIAGVQDAGTDKAKAARRAITMVAAEIGRRM